MQASTRRLHETLIRLLKGCIKAWEAWVREQPVEQPVESKSSSPSNNS